MKFKEGDKVLVKSNRYSYIVKGEITHIGLMPSKDEAYYIIVFDRPDPVTKARRDYFWEYNLNHMPNNKENIERLIDE